MSANPLTFGAELRRRRLAAGRSLAGLAAEVHYSKSHLSRVESGAKPPSAGLARQCDTVLEARGALIALLASPGRDPEGVIPRHADHWRLTMAPDGGGEFVATAGDAGATVLTKWARNSRRADVAGTVESFDRMFRELRVLGQNAAPSAMVPLLIGHIHVLRAQALSAPARSRGRVLLTAARYAEYTGWMCQEAGDEHSALWWTGTAAEWAEAAGDRDLGPYALVRQALVSLYRGDAVSTVEQARAAQQADCSARVRGLAAQREAQGLALAGDHDGCRRALDHAAVLLTASGDAPETIGSWTVEDPVALARGWCLYDLGRPAAAAEVIRGELKRIPLRATRARARFGAWLALAYAEAGAVDEACAAADPVLATLPIVDSATVRNDVRDLSRVLTRRHRNSRAREFLPRLSAALNERRRFTPPVGTPRSPA
ncbi:helix-turn-helix domain-containing protein [Actinoplanes sp. CA-142083]|uniref:helix-turn-helix domain-containing protein n=1 Tax=Actinoplanes sp. CA-142083 TaxID=3239903 RepID=UPI003D94B962